MTLREQFDSLSLGEIEEFVKEGREEDLHLDFKIVKDAYLKSRDDRRTFAVCASGFANSDGGLVVWGIDARPNADGIDCAVGAPGISGLKKLLSKLNEYTGSVLNPTLIGIDHRIVESGQNSDHGFVVTLIPVSDSGPHMAKLGEDRYYRRSGSSFLVMEHFEIADMFGRRPQPKLALTYRSLGLQKVGSTWHLHVELHLENRGRGSARAPYSLFRCKPPFRVDEFGLDGNRNHGLPKLTMSRDGSDRFGASGDIFLHPGTSLGVTRVKTEFPGGSEPSNLEVYYEIGAADQPLVTGTLQISVEKLKTPS